MSNIKLKGVYKDPYEMALNWEKDKNSSAPILLKDFEHRHFVINKSYLIREEDVEHASRVKKPNSISFIEAIKLRWCLYIIRDIDDNIIEKDLEGCKKPLWEVANSVGLELYLDPSEVVDLRGH